MASIFNRFFKSVEAVGNEPNIKFGRYSDSYKSTEQYDEWDKALVSFQRGKYLDCYRSFFKFLKDEEEGNLEYWEEGHGIRFEFIQGSKKIGGFADRKKFKAETKVVKVEELELDFMQRLIEANFDLKYSRYALDNENNIAMVFDTHTLDGSPYKLYFALKELATKADKQDDLLVEEFESLTFAEISHLKGIPEPEKEAKYQFIQSKITEVFDELKSGVWDEQEYPGAVAYLFLNLTYKLDYLTKPEGFMMESLERIHRLYFSNNQPNTDDKNAILKWEFNNLLQRSKSDFFKGMYEVPATFGITSPVNHDKIATFIDVELPNMDWYQEQGYDAIAEAIPGYIIGYSLFYYAVPVPDRDLFHLYFKIIEPTYFQSLGFEASYYNPKTNKFNSKIIKRTIKMITVSHKNQYPQLSPAVGSLNFDSVAQFAKSYLLMIKDLDMMKIDN